MKLTTSCENTTIPSHMDAKKSITCPVLSTPGSRTGKTATLLSYFDIKFVSYRSDSIKKLTCLMLENLARLSIPKCNNLINRDNQLGNY